MMATDNGYAQDSYVQESRKRQLDVEDTGRGAKRPNIGSQPLLKLLVPNYVAGALIGKGGALLSELKSTYGGFIRLSSGREYYPGSEERVVVITGEVNQIIDLNNHIMEKLQDPGRDSSMKNVEIDQERTQRVKIVLTDAASGLLIGRGGATIKGIQEESKAKVSVAMPDKVTFLGERIVTISGSFDERTSACKKVIQTIATDISNMANTKTKYLTASPDMYGYQGGALPPINNRPPPPQQQDGRNSFFSGNAVPRYAGGNDSYQSVQKKLPAKVQVEVLVPNVMVGAILGKHGSIIKDMVQRSGGARFKFEDKTEETNRTLTITGDMDQTQLAYSLLNERVEQLRNQPNAQGF